jgi:hypothetical protein
MTLLAILLLFALVAVLAPLFGVDTRDLDNEARRDKLWSRRQ